MTRKYLQDFLFALSKVGEYLILDTETTGLDDAEIVDIAIINHLGEVLLDTLVKPRNPIPPEASAVHGITDEDVLNAPSWVEIAPRVQDIIQDKVLVIYNVSFDRKMLYRSMTYAGMEGIEWFDIPAVWLCAMEAFAVHFGEWNRKYGNYRWKPLSFAARAQNVEVANAHRALGDCYMTNGVIKSLMNKYVYSS